MKKSVEITDQAISEAITMLGVMIKRRLEEKGRDSFVNAHEVLGATEVEVMELREAVHGKDPNRVMEELIDVGVGCIFGVASLRMHPRTNGIKK